MARASIRVLAPGDGPALEAFLAAHADSSMFLRANLRRAGLEDQGDPFHATYAALVENGAVQAVAAHAWSGLILLQAPRRAEALVRAAGAACGREVAGLLGPDAQVRAVRRALPGAASFESREILYALALERLAVPAALEAGAWCCRRPRDDELALVVGWSVAYQKEALRVPDGDDLWRGSWSYVVRLQGDGCQWLLEVEGRPVAYCAFNAVLPERVQVGGVWTPPELRGRGYARAVVAGALLAARAEGTRRAVLFTAEGNLAARRAYRGLGFAPIGDYGIVLYG